MEMPANTPPPAKSESEHHSPLPPARVVAEPAAPESHSPLPPKKKEKDPPKARNGIHFTTLHRPLTEDTTTQHTLAACAC